MPRPTTIPHLAASLRTKGANIALDLIREIDDSDPADMSMEDEYRGGRPQQNVAAPHLTRLMALGDDQAIQAFAAVLTAYLSETTHHGVPTMDALTSRSRQPAVQS